MDHELEALLEQRAQHRGQLGGRAAGARLKLKVSLGLRDDVESIAANPARTARNLERRERPSLAVGDCDQIAERDVRGRETSARGEPDSHRTRSRLVGLDGGDLERRFGVGGGLNLCIRAVTAPEHDADKPEGSPSHKRAKAPSAIDPRRHCGVVHHGLRTEACVVT